MPYEVLARKWRPKNFSELLGQDSVRQTLSNALRQNRLYPVLLFTGPRGTGKTSTARILAKNLRCKNQVNFIPCDKCEDCLFIQDSRHMDVMEIDGASNNGVEAVRELRDTVSYMPSSGSWKVYIIDEAHMLSNSAFNALLKTFEEPPAHVLFIMATTEIRKIPQTVLSRVQRLDFRLLSPSAIKKQLENICKKENFSIPEDILWIIAKQARGSLRDGQSLLDQVITFCGEDLNREKVTALLGLSDPHILFQCLQSLVHGREKDLLALIETLRAKSIEPRVFLQNLIEAVSQLLFLKKNPENTPELVHASRQEIDQMKKEIEFISYEDLHFLFDILLKGEREMSFCHDSQLAMEVLLLRSCSAPRLEQIVPLNPSQKNLKPADPLEKKPDAPEKTPPPTPLNHKNKSPASASESSALASEDSTSSSKSPTSVSESSTLASRSQKQKEAGDFEKRFDFLDFLQKKDRPLAALVENLCLQQDSPKHFCFIVPAKLSYLKNKIADPDLHRLLEEQLTEFLNSKEKVNIKFLHKEAYPPNLKEEKQNMEQENLFRHVQQNSFVNEVKDLFGGEVKTVIKGQDKAKG